MTSFVLNIAKTKASSVVRFELSIAPKLIITETIRKTTGGLVMKGIFG